jgi:hypothetical protein
MVVQVGVPVRLWFLPKQVCKVGLTVWIPQFSLVEGEPFCLLCCLSGAPRELGHDWHVIGVWFVIVEVVSCHGLSDGVGEGGSAEYVVNPVSLPRSSVCPGPSVLIVVTGVGDTVVVVVGEVVEFVTIAVLVLLEAQVLYSLVVDVAQPAIGIDHDELRCPSAGK